MTVIENKEFGVNVWWSVPNFIINADEAYKVLEKHGFEEENMPHPSQKLIVSRASRSFQNRRSKYGRTVVDRIKDNSEYLVYGILDQTTKGWEELGYEQSTKVTLNKNSGHVVAVGAQSSEYYRAHQLYSNSITNEDVGDFLRRVIALTFGIAKRPSGGIYFVPQRFVPIIESAQAFLNELNVGAKLYVERVMNGEQEREIVWDAVENNIDSQITSTLNSVARISKRAENVQSYEAKLDEMNGLMDIYRQLLGEEAKHEEIAEKLNEASNEVARKMAELQNNDAGNFTNYSIIPEVKNILEEEGAPLGFREIASRLESRGVELKRTASRDEAQWVALQINESTRKGIVSGIVKHGRGVYSLDN
jgi:hypothetical protein